jgi:PPOX class probable F420-dependent enzyme
MKTLSPAAAEFVAAGRVARLGTVDARGQPLVVPVCYAFDGRAWYSAIDGKPKRATERPLRRIRNIAENPRVSVLIDHYEEDWGRLRYVILQGAASTLSDGPEYARAVDLLRAKYRQYATVPVGGPGQVIIRVTPDSVVEWTAAA